MKHLLTTTIRIYTKNIAHYNKIMAIVLVPVIILRVIANYAEFGSQLNVAFSTIFGIILNFVLLLVILFIIKTTDELVKPAPTKPTKKELTNCAKTKFFEFIILVIAIGLITLSVPILMLFFKKFIPFETAQITLETIAYLWAMIISLLFIFSSFSLILENNSPIRALKRSAELFGRKPLETVAQLIIAFILVGIFFTLLAAIANVSIGFITKQTDLLFNAELVRYFSPWWKSLIIDIFAYLGLPLLLIATTIRFNYLRKMDDETNTS
jgi:hypothetical protein